MRNRFFVVLVGSLGFLYYGVIIGMVSLVVFACRQVNAFFRREPVAAAIVSVLIIGLSVGWMVTFVHERHQRVTMEHRADSLAYDLSKFTQMYDMRESVIFNGDTIKY